MGKLKFWLANITQSTVSKCPPFAKQYLRHKKTA